VEGAGVFGEKVAKEVFDEEGFLITGEWFVKQYS
jgi:hypothetical protein